MQILPVGFNVELIPDPVDRGKIEWFYRRFAEQQYDRYGAGHFIFAAYATVPALLTPDLLYKIWVNFNEYYRGEQRTAIHRVAVPDLLLSPLCREIGAGLYEMPAGLRNALLAWLEYETNGAAGNAYRLTAAAEIARFVVEYVQQSGHGSGYSEAQLWNAYSFFDPARTQQLLLGKLKRATDATEKIRILETIDKTNQRLQATVGSLSQLRDFHNLATLASGWSSLLQRNQEAFLRTVEANPALRELLSTEPGGIAIDITLEKSRAERFSQVEPPTLWALCIGIDRYGGALPDLNGCVSDATAFAAFLESFAESAQLRFQPHTLLDTAATADAVAAPFESFQQARNGDFCVFFYSGHAASKPADELGRRFIFHDSRVGDVEEDVFQGDFEQAIYRLLAEKRVYGLWVFDTHEVRTEEMKRGLTTLPLRKNARQLQGSLVILNGVQPGQTSYETVGRLGKKTGIFTAALLEVLGETGSGLSYRNLMEKTGLRMLQANDFARRQTPFFEAIPETAADLFFLSEVYDRQPTHKVVYDAPAAEWRLLAGRLHGVTPSLGFMHTLVRIGEKTEVAVSTVFPGYSVLSSFGEKDQTRTFDARIVQTALPKVRIAFDRSLNARMQDQFEQAVKRYDIYFIDLVGPDESPAYFIRDRDGAFFLTRSASIYDSSNSAPAPVFTYVREPFEFIKHIEYIAQWTGVLEYQRTGHTIKRDDVQLEFELIEGQSISLNNVNSLTGRRVAGVEALELRYMDIGRWRPPALRVLAATANKKLFVQALYLDSRYGITLFEPKTLEHGHAPEPLELTIGTELYNAVPLQIENTYLERGIEEIQDFLKIFVTDQPIDLHPLAQPALSFAEQHRVTRSAAFSEGKSTEEKSTEEKRYESVRLVGIDWITITIPIKISRKEEPAPPAGASPALPRIHPLQWHLRRTDYQGVTVDAHCNVEDAWRTTLGAGATVALIGTDGVDTEHPEFAERIVHAFDFVKNTAGARPHAQDENSDTAYAGLICAAGVDSAGVAPRANLMPIRLKAGLGSSEEARAFAYACEHGADVIVYPSETPDGNWWDPADPVHTQVIPLPDSTRLAFEYCLNKGRQGKGCVICLSAGNGNEDIATDGYATYAHAIVVAACNDRGTRSVYSDYGDNIWCCFPSGDYAFAPFRHPAPHTEGLRTTDRTGKAGYAEGNYVNSMGGTSSSACGVAGIVALMLAARPDLYWHEVKTIIKDSCTKIDPKNGEYDAEGHSKYYGYGRIDAARAVHNALRFERAAPKAVPDLQALAAVESHDLLDELARPENQEVCRELQAKLCALGLLDPVIGGDEKKPFGPMATATGVIDADTLTALVAFCRRRELPFDDRRLTGPIVRALLEAEADRLLPLHLDSDPSDQRPMRLAKRVLRYMRDHGYWIARAPGMYNIVYVSGLNPDGRPNASQPNEWHDLRLVIEVSSSGRPELLLNERASIKPGQAQLKWAPPEGAPLIAYGQYKAWVAGRFIDKQPVLWQIGPVRIYRDRDQNNVRSAEDPIMVGDALEIHQHGTSPTDNAPRLVGKWAAGALVGRDYNMHLAFIELVGKDIRAAANPDYRFMTTVLDGNVLVHGDKSGMESLA